MNDNGLSKYLADDHYHHGSDHDGLSGYLAEHDGSADGLAKYLAD